MNLLTGQVMEGYTIGERISRSGFSELYQATTTDQAQFAIKFLRGTFTDIPNLRRRFEREIELLQAIQHPHVIPILASGFSEEYIYLVMPFVPGQDLGYVLEKKRFSPREVWSIIEPISSALAAGHALQIVHRDLKPENILVAPPEDAPHYYLADFGLAKRPGIDETLTSAGLRLGTAEYMSPEAVLGQAVDARADIYSLAIMVYELLIGDVPFNGNPVKVAMAHARLDPQPLIERNTDVPPALNDLIMKNLAKKPDDRHPTIEAFAQAYQAILNALPLRQQTQNYWLH